MPRLTAKKRRRLKKSEFALPGKRAYPINDRRHAILAKGRAKQMEEEGKLSPSSEAHIIAKANRKLGKGRKRRHRRMA